MLFYWQILANNFNRRLVLICLIDLLELEKFWRLVAQFQLLIEKTVVTRCQRTGWSFLPRILIHSLRLRPNISLLTCLQCFLVYLIAIFGRPCQFQLLSGSPSTDSSLRRSIYSFSFELFITICAVLINLILFLNFLLLLNIIQNPLVLRIFQCLLSLHFYKLLSIE